MNIYLRERRVWYRGKVIVISQPEYKVLQDIMFMQIWRDVEHKCIVTGDRIHNPLTYHFHHILEKRNYELYSLCKWDIALIDDKVHNNYETKPDTVPFLVDLRTELLLKLSLKAYNFDNDTIWNRSNKNHLIKVFDKYSFKSSKK